MPSRERGLAPFVLILIVAAIMAALIAAFVLFRSGASSKPSSSIAHPLLTEEQKAYLQLLEFTDARMSAAENFLGGAVTYLDARVTNKGGRVVRGLAVELNFFDTLNQVVLREAARPINQRTGPLKPGESRPFRVSFEHMPMDWNEAPPAIKPVFVQF
jgi:hypothetical protein